MLNEKRVPTTVHVQEVRKVFPGAGKANGETTALAGVSLDFRPGAFTTLLGPSGCGKTTLLRIIAGFTQADRGTVWIGEREMTRVPPWKRDIGFVFQNYALWPHMSVRDNVAYGLRLRKLARREISDRVQTALEGIGLGNLAERYPSQLSGGQQQRVALARALVLRPQVLLLDEPLSNLDAKLRIELRKEIRRIQQSVGITTIYVTHDQEEALEISDVVAVMSRGQVEQIGTPEEIYQKPGSVFVATFVGAVSLIAGTATAEGKLATASGLTLPLKLDAALFGRQVTVAIRPENISLLPADAADASAVQGRAVSVSFLGNVRRVVLDIGGGITLLSEYRGTMAEGDAVKVAIHEYTLIPDRA
jgi:ABC-type Fe3+/spermidine/putrescine transport system ATPase subunit